MSEEVRNNSNRLKILESQKFHDRIKRIFINSGFNITKSDYYSKGADIIANVDNKKIIIQCKCAQSDDKGGLNIDGLIDEYSKKAEREKAERAVLAISKYKIPPHYLSDEEKKEELFWIKWSSGMIKQ